MPVTADTLQSVTEDLANDRRTPRADRTLRRRCSPLASSAEQLRILAGVLNGQQSAHVEFETLTGELRPAGLDIFQVNVGKLCNMTCRHCHVDAGPDRTDAIMSDEIVYQVIAAIGRTRAHTVDITGGAPELHPRFRDLVEAAVAAGKHVMDRCNLTVLLLPRSKGLIDWFAERKVEVVASLPHYRRPNTDAQRGKGVFDRSIEAMRLLNAAGYGRGAAGLRLTLVSNPAEIGRAHV